MISDSIELSKESSVQGKYTSSRGGSYLRQHKWNDFNNWKNPFLPFGGLSEPLPGFPIVLGRPISKDTMIEQEDFQKFWAKSGWRIIPKMEAMEGFFEKANGDST